MLDQRSLRHISKDALIGLRHRSKLLARALPLSDLNIAGAVNLTLKRRHFPVSHGEQPRAPKVKVRRKIKKSRIAAAAEDDGATRKMRRSLGETSERRTTHAKPDAKELRHRQKTTEDVYVLSHRLNRRLSFLSSVRRSELNSRVFARVGHFGVIPTA